MSNIWFTSDAHLGHRNIHKLRPRFATAEEHDDWYVAEWTRLVKPKRDTVFCLGDMAFSEAALARVLELPGKKILVKGNHDVCAEILEPCVYHKILGLFKYKKVWLSHAPIHPDELRGKVNVHGHVHGATVQNPRYFNICPEHLCWAFDRPLITLVELRDWISSRFPGYYKS